MKYVMMIYSDETREAQMTKAERDQQMQAYYAFTQEVSQRGVYQGGEALMPTQTATTVRVRDGKTLTTDGPFAETKEQLGGFYLIHCKDLDEAIEIASKIPGAREGSVEIRPLLELN